MTNWKCPICGHEIPGGSPDYYSYGTDRQVQILEGEVEKLNNALTHVIIKHLMSPGEMI